MDVHITTIEGQFAEALTNAARELAKICVQEGLCAKETFPSLKAKEKKIYAEAYVQAFADYLLLKEKGILKEPEFIKLVKP